MNRVKSKTKRKPKSQRVTVQWAYDKQLWLEGELRYKGVIVSSIEQTATLGRGLNKFEVIAGLTFKSVLETDIMQYSAASKPGKSKYKNKIVYAYSGAPNVIHRSKIAAGKWADNGVLRLDLGKLLKFDSMAEAHYWQYLNRLEESGMICDLKLQVSYPLYPVFEWEGKTYKRTYRADFTYQEREDESGDGYWRLVIVDVKGFETELFKLKWELFIAHYYDKLATREWRFELVNAKEWS